MSRIAGNKALERCDSFSADMLLFNVSVDDDQGEKIMFKFCYAADSPAWIRFCSIPAAV